MKYLKLIKLLYFVDREYIRQTGSSFTKDTYYSMKDGPVLSNVYDLIKANTTRLQGSYWNRTISERTNYVIKIINEPNFDVLSQAAKEIADKVYGKLTDWTVRDTSHNLPEYFHIDKGRKKIEYKDIAKALSFPDHLIDEYLDESRTNEFVHRVLSP